MASNSGSDLLNRNDAQVRALALAVMQQLPFEPGEEQLLLIVALAHFVLYAPERGVFLLTGYAGTGKTTVLGALVRALQAMQRHCLLLAPTGRAAHILAEYSGLPAYTIHRKIYRQHSYGSDTFMLADNRLENTLVVVDEASMIANGGAEGGSVAAFGSGHLLDDLISFAYNGRGCRLMLIGDSAQLPPVGSVQSPALSEQVLQNYQLAVYMFTLRQVARQAAQSGILHNATMLRQNMEQDMLTTPQLDVDNFADLQAVSSEYVMEILDDCYGSDGLEQTIVVTRSNRRATLFNTGIRNRILYREEELSGGDILVVAKNNYFWAEDYDELDFIANGDVLRVRRLHGEVEHAYGLRFVTATVELPDHGGLEMQVKVVLDALLSDTPALTREQNERLLAEVWEELSGDRRERFRQLKKHPYFNALQVKFAYAVTCHKAQGGQWHNVLIDMGGIPPEATTTLDYYRWLYTAISRARKHVYLINYLPPSSE